MSRRELLNQLHLLGQKNNIPNISKANEIFLRNFISTKEYSQILEIGSANGYSTICFADELERNGGGKIISIEFSQQAYEDAQENFRAAKVEDMIEYYFGDARDIIPFLDRQFDFIFIDGLKKASLEFYLLCRNLLTRGGTIIIDDVIKFRHKMEDFYEYLDRHHISYSLEHIDEDDGIMIIPQQ